jgi:DNA replication protein DnaC
MNDLQKLAKNLKLHGLLAHWHEISDASWLPDLLAWEEEEKARRGLERRLSGAHIGAFKPLADFDWKWPKKIDRDQIEDLFRFDWIESATNVVLVGPNGVGKTMIARNLVHQAVLNGTTARCITASELLNALAEAATSKTLQRKLAFYCRPQLLVIDELGYLAYDNRHADLLYEIISRRYLNKPIVVTTNKPFGQWNEVFPNAGSVVTIVDRLVHRCEVIPIEGESYRLKESKELTLKRAKRRKARIGKS